MSKRVALWGPAEHVDDAAQRSLAGAIASLGAEVEELPRSAPPPRAHAIVINTKVAVGERELAAMPALELIVTTTSGYDHVDLDAAARRGVAVARCPLARRDAVVDCALAMGLALLRRLPRMHRAAESGRWMRGEVKELAIPAIDGLAVGIVGLGVIGRRAREVFGALGCRVLACDPDVAGAAPLDDVLRHAELLTLHCSLTASSRRLLGAARIAVLRPGAVVLNTARGECVDLDALLAASHLGGLGLDVFEREPPARLAEIARRDDAIVTPHSAGYSRELGARIAVEVEAAIGAWVRGTPIAGRVV